MRIAGNHPMNESEHHSRQFLSTVWKLAEERITTQSLNMPIIDAKSALRVAAEKVNVSYGRSEVETWMIINLKMGSHVFTEWFDGIYRSAFQEPAGSRYVLCRQIHRLACGQLLPRGHRALDEAHEIFKQNEADPWAIAWNDLKKNEAKNG